MLSLKTKKFQKRCKPLKIQRSTINLEKKKVFVKENVWFTHISDRIYLLRNCFSKYVYLKHKCSYITLKGIRKIVIVSVLRILLICKFLKLTIIVAKEKLNFPKFVYNFSYGKVNISTIHPTHITLKNTTVRFC